jgi:lipopolysaccharide export LptBFGC system permease protein LptF
MYPPSDESDDARVARNQAQARWILPVLWIVWGMAAFFFSPHGARSKVAWVGIGVFSIADLILEKNGARKKKRLSIIIPGLVLVMVAAILLKP